MKAYLFPGQGSQFPGMGRDLYEAYSEARAVFDEADEVLGFPLTACCFSTREDAMRALTQTDVCQPAIFTHSVAAFRALKQAPDAVAGHSVGEYSALAACGAISLPDGLRTIRVRAQLMAQAGKKRPGTMSAILGLDHEILATICSEASQGDQVVQPANFNAPGQVVISGDTGAVRRAGTLAKERGAMRVIPLNVSGAFHSVLMQEVHKRFMRQVAGLAVTRPASPIYLNTTGCATTDTDKIRTNMIQQLTSPVRWMQSLKAMQADGITSFVEVGPGRVLTGLVRRTLGRTTSAIQAGTKAQITGMHTVLSS